MAILAKFNFSWNVNDSSGNWNNWTNTNVTFADWKSGQAWVFTWAWSYVSFPNLWITTNSTFNFYVLTTTLSVEQSIIWLWTAPWNWTPNIRIRTNWEIWFIKSQIAALWESSWFSFETNKWTMVTVTYDWTNIKFYKNWDYVSWASSTNSFTSTYVYWFGREWNDNYFNWRIDEATFENRVWSATEIKNKYAFYNWFI